MVGGKASLCSSLIPHPTDASSFLDRSPPIRYNSHKSEPVKDKTEHPSSTLPTRNLRPPPAGHTWAWIIISVSVVILISITMWVVVSGETVVDEIGDREATHQIVSEWRDRWSQAPGPPEAYAKQAADLATSGEFRLAMIRLSMALALDPNRVEDWVHMVCLSGIRPPLEHGLSADEVRTILGFLDEEMVPPEKLKIARRWEEITQTNGPPFPRVIECFAAPLGSGTPKTGVETLDTLPVPP